MHKNNQPMLFHQMTNQAVSLILIRKRRGRENCWRNLGKKIQIIERKQNFLSYVAKTAVWSNIDSGVGIDI